MTTATTTTRIRHDSDATFREWGLEMQTKLLAVGLSADELTTNWTTATRPGTNTEYGYEVYHLNDSLHGSFPIYIRIGYGTGGSANQPNMTITVGTSTNGSGVISGQVRSIVTLTSSSTETTDTTYTSRWCAASGFFGMHYKTGSSSAAGFVVINRTSDYTGVPAGQSFAVIYSSQLTGGARTRCGRWNGSFLSTDNGSGVLGNALCFTPLLQDTGAASDDTIYPAAVTDSTRRWLHGVVGRHNADGAVDGNTFTFAGGPGGVSHTYMALSTSSPGLVMDPQSAIRYCMLWE